ncbi:MAG: hypothetical protein DWQ08_08650 [Proteobacteria bacterium]|nr:MAG: hypothetical protein DWQ08_08650 [Pseudomonadota bacterium]
MYLFDHVIELRDRISAVSANRTIASIASTETRRSTGQENQGWSIDSFHPGRAFNHAPTDQLAESATILH